MADSTTPFRRDLGGRATLDIVRLADAEELFALVDASRMHLRQWLPWVDANVSRRETEGFLLAAQKQRDEDAGFQCAIRLRGRIAGIAGYYHVDWFHRQVELGYWIGEDHQGRGLATRSCAALIEHAFAGLDLHRVAIRAGVDNRRSRAVAERLGFVHEGTLRQSQWLNDRFVDLAVYGLLRPEWSRP